jgi:ligand-binding sensor domain-containing protein
MVLTRLNPRKYTLFVLFSTFVSSFATAQTEHWTQYFHHFGTNTVVIDPQGHKWVGTKWGGVAEYNGVTWKVYNLSNSGIGSNTVYDIALDAEGNKWFATEKGVSKFDGTRWTNYNKLNSGLNATQIRTIAIDAQGNKWLGSYRNGLFKFNDTTWTHYDTQNSLIHKDEIIKLVVDKKNLLWVSFEEGGVNKFNGRDWSYYILPDEYVSTMAVDTQNVMWFAARTVISKFDGNTWFHYNREAGVSSMVVDKLNNKWMATRSGVLQFNGQSWQFYSQVNERGFNGIAVDKDYNIWLSDGENGLVHFDKSYTYVVNPITAPHLKRIPYIPRTAAKDKQGHLWFNTLRFDGANWTDYGLSTGIDGASILNVLIDAQDNKWFLNGLNIFKYNNRIWKKDTIGNVVTMAIDAQNTKWLGISSVGIATWDDKTGQTILQNSGLPRGEGVLYSAVDLQNNKWFGGTLSGVYMFNGNRWTVYDTTNSGLLDNYVHAIVVDAKGHKWFGTAKGVSKFDGTTWTNYTTANSGLVCNETYSIAEDPQGNMWFGTVLGVSKWDGVQWRTYTTLNSSLGENFIKSILIDGQNKWFMGMGQGIVSRLSDCKVPVPDFTYVRQPNRTFQFTNRSSDLSNATYQWTFGDGQTSSLPNPSVTYSKSGIYTVKLLVKNDGICVQEHRQKVVDVPTAYPNPAQNDVSIESPSDFQGRIYNRLGQLVQLVELKTGDNLLDIRGLAAGVYYLKYENGVAPFVKQ